MSSQINPDGSVTFGFTPGYPTRYTQDPAHWDQTGSFFTLTAAEYAAFLGQWVKANTAIPPTFTVSSPGAGVAAPNAGKPLVTTKNPNGSTATVHGQVPGTTVVVNNPG